MAGFNINGCIDAEFHTKTFHEIADAKVHALEGIGAVGENIFEDGHTRRNTVHSVRDLGTWRYYRLARALVDLRDAEHEGKREAGCEASLRAGLIKAWAGKSLAEICAAPLHAFKGLAPDADDRFARAPLHITSVEKLAECKFCRWASAICTLAELGEEDVPLARATRALETAETERKEAVEARLKAEQVAEAAKAAMAEAVRRAEAAEKAKAGAEEVAKEAEKAKEGAEKAAKEEHQKEEEAHKAEERAKAEAAATEDLLQGALKKLQELEKAKEEAEKKQKEEQQKRRAAERAAALEAQERKGKELEARYRKLFKEIDHNGDGNLSHTELKSYVARVDPAMRLKLGIGRWQDFLAEVDADGDGRINEEEFVSHFTRTNLDPVKCYGALFDAIDCHGTGVISQGEFRDYAWYKNPNLFRLLGVSSWEQFMRTLDFDGDGAITRDEFVAHYSSLQNAGALLSFGDDASAEPAAKRARV